MKILAIDDNKDNLTTLNAVMRDALPECEVFTALNGPEGIALARTEDPDVVLLDIVMPEMDGFEVCRRLKADAELSSIPVIFLTSLRTDRESRIKAINAGGDAFLTKPLDEQSLTTQVRAMVKVRMASRLQQMDKKQLEALVEERTRELERELAERKQTEKRDFLAHDVLNRLNQSGPLSAMIADIIQLIKKSTGSDAVGIRLRIGDDFPYYVQSGFSADFLKVENTLVVRDKEGVVCTHKDGSICLECTCGLVLSGKTDPANPLFTQGGSCWTNNSFPLMDMPADHDPRLHPRNRCVHDGFLSVALIPLREGSEIIGLLQLNDRLAGRFTLAQIQFLERLAASIAIALKRERAEATLAEAEKKYRGLFEESVTAVYVFDSQKHFVDTNQAGLDLLGYSRDELLRLRIPDVDADPVVVLPAHQELLSGARLVNYEHKLRRKDGAIVTVLNNSRSLTDDNGTVVGLLSTLIDVTERKQAEEKLRMTQAILQAAMDQSTAGIAIADAPSGELRYVNDAGLLIRGGTRETVVNGIGINQYVASWKILDFDGRPLRADEVPLSRAIMFGETCSREFIICRTEGDDRTVLAKAAPIKDESGKIVAGIVVFLDITDSKRTEQEKDKLQSQLAQAQKMESVGRLAGGVAHDFNNLLMGIMSYVDLCRDELPADHLVRCYLDEITSDAQRSADLTRQLLAFARKQMIAPKVLDLNDTVGKMLNLLRRLIGENINLTWSPGPNLWNVKLDPSQVDQILANLCVNARDSIAGVGKLFIETSNITVDEPCCEGHVGAVPGEYILLAVSDTGHGMAKEVLDHIFEPFFTTKEIGKGTGLGLATVFGIVTQNKGFITVYSEPGKGTTFKIYLPRFAAQIAAPAAAGTSTQAPRGSETILLVEDEKSVRFTTQLILKKLGYNVLVAEDPDKALHLAAEHVDEIHLLITDIIMPGMSGSDLALQLCGLRPAIKRLFMSGFTADVIAQEGVLEEGMPFLTKPFDRDQLARKVREILEGR